MAKLGNVIQLNLKNDDKHVYGTIHTFLTRRKQRSEHTKNTYERAIRDFFRTMRNKELEDLVEADLIFSKKQIERYQMALKEEDYAGKTVNNAITAIRECYKRLEDDGFDVSERWFAIERCDEDDSVPYDAFTHDEVIQIIDLVANSTRKKIKGREKALFVRLAFATAFRKSSLQSLKWTDIVKMNDVMYIKTIGKGKVPSYKKLSQSLYEELMSFKEEVNREKIFTLTNKTINDMMTYIRKNMDFGDRRIAFHSFKKASMDEVNLLSGGDLKAIQHHGDHKNVTTSLNSYISKKKLEDLVVVDTEIEPPVEKFDEMSRDELLALVKGMDRSTIIRMLQKSGHMKG
jgi:site-specific recombinase XerD